MAAVETGGTITIGRAVVEAEAEVAAGGEVVETIDTTTGTTIAKGMVRIIAGSSRMESAMAIAATTVTNTDATTAIKGIAITAG